jgi:hypothetical protein
MTMALFDKLKEELDRAGKAAQGAFDEGKIRLEAFRTRQLADKAAQALGYAVFRAKQSGSEIDADSYARLSATLATHDAEAARYEAELDRKRKESAANRAASSASTESASTASASTASASSADTSTTSEAPPSAS